MRFMDRFKYRQGDLDFFDLIYTLNDLWSEIERNL